jgi:hypothetical protein
MAFRVACMMTLLLGASLVAWQKNEDNTTRSLEGRVTDSANQPIDQAVVQLKNTKTLQIRSFITLADGGYHFAGLQTDVEYAVKATHAGASTSWKTLSVFNSKKNPILNLKLKK